MNAQDLTSIVAQLRSHIATGDVRAALRYLNSLTRHRFTGLYRFDDPALHNLHIIDKLNPNLESTPDVPLTATYCAFTRSNGALNAIEDALEDPRFADHPARREVRSYCGVPLLDEHGEVFGTICHFDYGVVDISDDTVHLLEMMAPLLREGKQAVQR